MTGPREEADRLLRLALHAIDTMNAQLASAERATYFSFADELRGFIVQAPGAKVSSYDGLLRDLGRSALAYDALMQEFAARSGYYAALAAVQAHPDHPKAGDAAATAAEGADS